MDRSGSERAEDAPAAMDSEFVRRISEVARLNQLIFFNPEATIQRQIVQDGFAPNSGEFEMPFGPARYVAQQAEHLRTGEVRVYSVKRTSGSAWVSEPGHRVAMQHGVDFVKRTSGSACNGFPWARPSGRDRSGSGRAEDAPTAMDSEFVRRISEVARLNQLIFFNPEATIQRQIVQDGFVPNSGEFEMPFGPARYVAQQAEHLRTGKVRVYFVKREQWHRVQRLPVGKA